MDKPLKTLELIPISTQKVESGVAQTRDTTALNLLASQYRAELDMVNALELLENTSPEFEIAHAARQTTAISVGIPAFFSTFMPKSGGTFLNNHLVSAGAVEVRHSTESPISAEQAYLIKGRVSTFLKGGATSHIHMRPSPWNIRIMKECKVKKLWVNVRDPRQAALSWYWYKRQIENADSAWVTEQVKGQETKDAVSKKFVEAMKFEQKEMDQQVRTFFSWSNRWMNDWWHVRNKLGIKMLFTTQEEMASDMNKFEQKVLKFFNAGHMVGVFGTATEKDRFRAGRTDEWRTDIAPETQKWMADQIAPEIAAEFGWTL
jgi:hypothetical protein